MHVVPAMTHATSATGGLDGAGPGLASGEAWVIAIVALAALLVAARWSVSRRRRHDSQSSDR